MSEKNKLHILWTNSDLVTTELMVMMYATNSKLHGWWDEVTVIIWGATAKLAAENEAVKEWIKMAQHAGVKFSACISCADKLGVTKTLEEMDVEVKRWGEDLSNLLKTNEPHISV